MAASADDILDILKFSGEKSTKSLIHSCFVLLNLYFLTAVCSVEGPIFHPYFSCRYQKVLSSGFTWYIALVMGGSRGVAL